MVTAGQHFTNIDGTGVTILCGKFDGFWNLHFETESVLNGVTTAEVEQFMARAQQAQQRAEEAKQADLIVLAHKIDAAWTAALAENEKRDAATRRVTKRSAKYVPNTDHLKYPGLTDPKPLELVLFVEDHYTAILASVMDIPRFRANYEDAGHLYADPMPGVTLASPLRWYDGFTVQLDGTPIPNELIDAIALLQHKCGIRDNDGLPPQTTHGIHCNALAWELIRRGAAVGPRK